MRKGSITLIISLILCSGILYAQEAKKPWWPFTSEKEAAEARAVRNALDEVRTGRDNEKTWEIINTELDSGSYFIIRMLSGIAEAQPDKRSKIVPILINAAINNTNSGARGHALNYIRAYPEFPGVQGAIVRMLKDEERWNRQRALEEVKRLRIKKAIPTLKETVITERDGILKQQMAEAIEYLQKVKGGPKEAIEDEVNNFIKQLNSADPQERLFAAANLGGTGYNSPHKERIITALLKAYDKESLRENKINMLSSLLTIDPENKHVLSLVRRESKSKDAEIRKLSEEILKVNSQQ